MIRKRLRDIALPLMAWPRQRLPLLVLLFTLPLATALAINASARQDLLSTMFHQHSAVMLFIDPLTGHIVDANQAALDFYQSSRAQLIGRRIDDLNVLGPDEVAAERARALAEERNYFVFPHRLGNGEIRTVEVYSSPALLSDGRTVLFSIIQDITGKRVAENELRNYQTRLEELVDRRTREVTQAQTRLQNVMAGALLAQFIVIGLLVFNVVRRRHVTRMLASREAQLTSLINAMPDIVRVKDGQGRWLETNRYALELYGLEGVDVRHRSNAELAALQNDTHPMRIRDDDHDDLVWRERGPVRSELSLPTAAGELRYFDAIKVPLFNPDGSRNCLVEVARDITERKRAESEIERLAYYDPLTALPNRRLLLDRLEHALANARRTAETGALLFVDLDYFKTLNDARGHEMGDRLLVAAAQRLRAHLRETDTVARFGGDEFVVLLPDIGCGFNRAERLARMVAEKIRADLATPFDLTGEEVAVSASIGVTLFPNEHDLTLTDLLKQADTAMYQAKDSGRNQIRFFEPEMQRRVETRFALEADLRRAVERNELRLFVQPQVDASGALCGSEALLRWQHPERGLVSPAVFIPIAEETGLIVEIGEWVLRESCSLLARHADRSPLRISVNVSPRQFHRADFVPRVRQILDDTGIIPERLTLEVTEGLVIDHLQPTVSKMKALHALGIRFSIDDFGTGYSSLAYIKQLPVNELKIDGSFVRDAPHDPSDAVLVDTILSVAAHLRLNVVAEGVESEEHAAFLRQRPPIHYQGYLFGRPQPAEAFVEQFLLANDAR